MNKFLITIPNKDILLSHGYNIDKFPDTFYSFLVGIEYVHRFQSLPFLVTRESRLEFKIETLSTGLIGTIKMDYRFLKIEVL